MRLGRSFLVVLLALPVAACAGPVSNDDPLDSNATEPGSLAPRSNAPPDLDAPYFDPCLTAAANVSAVFGPNQASTYYGSSNTAYASTPCGRLVFDLHVPWNHAPPVGFPNYFPDFRFSSYSLTVGEDGVIGDLTSEECKDTWVQVTYYKKATGTTSFKKVGGGTIRGAIDPSWANKCRLSPTSTYSYPGSFEPPATGTDLYRVAIRARTKGAASGVAIRAFHGVDEPQ